MSGGGNIIEKRIVRLEDGREVVRYWLLTGEHDDELCVYAEPQDDEPGMGDAIWWGGGEAIYWGPNDGKRLRKVGFSFRPTPTITGGSDA